MSAPVLSKEMSAVPWHWLRPKSDVLHLATPGSSAAFCGVSLHDAIAVASNRRVCGHCARSKR